MGKKNHPESNIQQPDPEIPRWLAPAAFIIGVLFLAAVLALIVAIPQPTLPQFQVFKIVLALGGAAFTMAVSGFIVVRLPIPGGGLIVGGGALAVFLILFFFSPAGKLVEEPKPKIGFLKNHKIFVANDNNKTLAILLKKIGGAKLLSEDQLPRDRMENMLANFEIERPREINDMIVSIQNDLLASDDTKQHLRDWLHDEQTIKIQILRILAAFGNRTLIGSSEYYAQQLRQHAALSNHSMILYGGDEALRSLEVMTNREETRGQSVDDEIITSTLRYTSAATTQLYSGLRAFEPKYFENVDEAFRDYMASVPSEHKEIVKTLGYANITDNKFVELECGGGHSYSRFIVPSKEISSTVARNKLENGPWPIGAPKDFFSERWWLHHATWQMLSREHGKWLDELPLRIEKFYAIGPP